MAFVLDASVLAEYLLATPTGTAVAQRIAAETGLHLPHLAIVETTSVLRGAVRGGHVSAERAQAALVDLADFPATRWAADPLLPRLWELRENLSTYDATYVALAEAMDATLLTADTRLARACRTHSACDLELVQPPSPPTPLS